MIKFRSTTGCWTCRLRRKKCDEEKPICNTCATRGLNCVNGKEKPSWMDGRKNEKEQLDKIKSLVKKSAEEKRQRRASKLRQQSSSSITQSNPTPTPQATTASTNLSIASPRGSDQHGLWHLTLLEDEAFNELDSSLITPTTIGDTLPDFGDVYPLESERSLVEIFSPQTCSEVSTFAGSFDPSPLSATEIATSYFELAHVATPTLTPTNTPSSNALVLCPQKSYASEEANGIVYYLERILGKQFPTYSLDPRANKGWIYVLLSTSSMVRSSIVSLSLAKRNTAYGNTAAAVTIDPTQAHYHSIAVRELHQHLSHIVEVATVTELQSLLPILVTSIQLISYEAIMGNYDSWTMHLKTASDTIHYSPAMSGALGATFKKHSTSNALDLQGDSVLDVIQLLVGIVVFYDVISSASLRIPHCIQDRSYLLDAWNIRTQDSFICETPAICVIADITELDTWKKNAAREGLLSVMELGTRSAQLRERISGLIATLSHALDECKKPRKSVEVAQLYCSLIYASAALTYLHVVVSEPHAALPEIKESVEQTIERMIELPDYKWLQYLVWPFCVTGCMASEAQEPFFSSIVAEAEMQVDEMDSLTKALNVMEQCWRQRGRQMQPVDWAVAMDSLDRKIMLI